MGRLVRPVVVGLLLWTAWDMAYSVFGVKRYGWSAMTVGWDKLLIVAIAFGLLTMTKINPAFIVLAAALIGGVVYR